eukprot:EC797849.1.p2 GENE.EC797849.1~~EC797849.1.p2  ORF type:complete len:113 (+),score=48.78 EC797849.1:142-480(+)
MRTRLFRRRKLGTSDGDFEADEEDMAQAQALYERYAININGAVARNRFVWRRQLRLRGHENIGNVVYHNETAEDGSQREVWDGYIFFRAAELNGEDRAKVEIVDIAYLSRDA